MTTGTGEATQRRRTRGRALAAALLAAAAALAPAARAEDAVALTARVDRTEVAADQTLTLEVRLEAPEAPTALELSEDGPFRITSRSQSRQASFSFGGGGVQARQVIVTTLVLAPLRVGDLSVPPVFAVVGGKRYETAPILVRVLPAGARAPPPRAERPERRATFGGWERDLVLDVQVDRREVFLGEQVTASVWLLSPLAVDGAERYQPPRHDGFWEEGLETPRTLQQQVRDVDGVPTRAYLLQRLALFPTRAGALELGAAEITVGVQLGGGSLFDPFPTVKRVTRRSAPVKIRVKPLPPGAPPGFASVNVGALALRVAATEPRVAAGQPVAIRITASGEGNVRALALPALPAIPDAKAFAPTTTDAPAPRGTRFGGARTVETVLVPSRTGELVIPPLAWPYFDPRSGSYEVARTEELRIPVGPGGAGGDPAGAGTNTLAAGLRPIRAGGELTRRAPPPWRSPLFAALLAAPPLAFAGLVVADRLRARTDRTAAARRRAGRAARARLARARRRLEGGDRAAFLAEVERALWSYAGDRLGHPAVGLTRDALRRALEEAGAHPPATHALLGALEVCERARYGGAATPPDEVLERALEAVRRLEEADWSRAEVTA